MKNSLLLKIILSLHSINPFLFRYCCMKKYYIHRIELVSSKEHGTIIEVVAKYHDRECSRETKIRCERMNYIFCPTFVIKYSRELYYSLVEKRDNHEAVLLDHDDFAIEKQVVRPDIPSKVYCVQKDLIKTGIWEKIRKSRNKVQE